MRDATSDFPAAVDVERERIAEADRRIAAAQQRIEQLGGALHIVGGAVGRASFLVSHGCLTKEFDGIEAAEAEAEAWLLQFEARA